MNFLCIQYRLSLKGRVLNPAAKKGLCLVFAVLFFSSCAAQINGRLMGDASGTVQIQAGIKPNMEALIRGIGNIGGGSTAPALDAEALGKSLRAAPGISSASFRNNGGQIAGDAAFSRIDDLLTAGGNRFIRYKAPSGGDPGRLGIRLDRVTAPKILSLISVEAVDYLSDLMAPAATGEILSKKDYLELVASIYGKGIADEIASSVLKVSIVFPGAVTSAKGGTFSGREARFEVSLPDILTLEQPLEYEITWTVSAR